MALRSLDLFSGIGGIATAFRGITTTQMYCERDARCGMIMRELFAKGNLHDAPINTDVVGLDGKELRGTIDMVCAGFPCIGFSSVGKRRGFEDPQSGLFSHVARLMLEVQPPFVFLENVPGVVNAGLDPVLQAFDAAGYDAWWLVLPAYAVGAPQSRHRWFCLGVRRDIPDGFEVRVDPPYDRHPWEEGEPVVRHMPGKMPSKRLSVLGNSVVPDCVRLAFLILFTGYTEPPSDDLWTRNVLVLTRPLETNTPLPARGGLRRCGSFIAGVTSRQSLPPGTIPRKPNLGLVMLPNCFVASRQHKAPINNVMTEPQNAALWGTPRGGCLGACNVLTYRGRNDICTQLRFEKNTPDDIRGQNPNPQWIEWLMGFKPDWTYFVPPPPVPKDLSQRRPRPARKPRRPKQQHVEGEGGEAAPRPPPPRKPRRPKQQHVEGEAGGEEEGGEDAAPRPPPPRKPRRPKQQHVEGEAGGEEAGGEEAAPRPPPPRKPRRPKQQQNAEEHE